jgi:hypothetical protein
LKEHLVVDPEDNESEYELMFFFSQNFRTIKRHALETLEEI